MKCSKKGVVGISLEQIIGLILALLFIILLTVIIAGLLRMFTKSADQGTVTMYEKISDAVTALTKEGSQHDSCRILVGYIEPDFGMVGFNREGEPNTQGRTGTRGGEDWGFVYETCGWDDAINKPLACLNEACICLCNGGVLDITGDDCKTDTRCRRFESVSRFTTKRNGNTVDMVLYGEGCAGGDNRVIAGYLVRRQAGGIEIESVMSSREMEQYTEIPDCAALIRESSREERQQREAQGTGDEREGREERDQDPGGIAVSR
jgi:hypothetical protein